jgi:RecQ-mediated genome instability protein 1
MDWVRHTYPKPTIDPAWLEACLAWIAEELHLNDFDAQGDEIISNVDSQLLNSDLRDSMLEGTGFPPNIGSTESVRLRGHILVQVQAMTEIGHSAFSLQNVQQTRIDRADLAGLTAEDDEDDGPIPKFPRSMLQFDLSDGSRSVKAIEYRKLPDLELGVTPLGYKVREICNCSSVPEYNGSCAHH